MGPPPRNAAPRVEPPRDPHAGKARDEPESRAARLARLEPVLGRDHGEAGAPLPDGADPVCGLGVGFVGALAGQGRREARREAPAPGGEDAAAVAAGVAMERGRGRARKGVAVGEVHGGAQCERDAPRSEGDLWTDSSREGRRWWWGRRHRVGEPGWPAPQGRSQSRRSA